MLVGLDVFAKILPLNKVHDHVNAAAVFANFTNGYDVGVPQSHYHFCFPHKLLAGIVVRTVSLAEYFDCFDVTGFAM